MGVDKDIEKIMEHFANLGGKDLQHIMVSDTSDIELDEKSLTIKGVVLQ